MDSRFKLVNSPRNVGISSSNRFGPNEIDMSVVTVASCVGMVPSKIFPPIASSWSGKSKRSFGNSLEKVLASMFNDSRLVAFAISLGNDPDILFEAKLMILMLLSFLSCGNLPDKLLKLRSRVCKLSFSKNVNGIAPIIPFCVAVYPSMAFKRAGASEICAIDRCVLAFVN